MVRPCPSRCLAWRLHLGDVRAYSGVQRQEQAARSQHTCLIDQETRGQPLALPEVFQTQRHSAPLAITHQGRLRVRSSAPPPVPPVQGVVILMNKALHLWVRNTSGFGAEPQRRASAKRMSCGRQAAPLPRCLHQGPAVVSTTPDRSRCCHHLQTLSLRPNRSAHSCAPH